MSWLDDPPPAIKAVMWGMALVGLYLFMVSVGLPLPIPGGAR